MLRSLLLIVKVGGVWVLVKVWSCVGRVWVLVKV